MRKLTHISLFTGIGGIDLAAEAVGFETVAQCEIADYPTKILEQHWPDVHRWRDVNEVTRISVEQLSIGGGVDLISAGFPCQPHSVAGLRKASEDERDLWWQVARVLREVKPRWFLGENVRGLLSSESGRFFGRVLRDLAEMGYTVEWGVLSAAEVGARHRRERVFIVGHTKHDGQPTEQILRSHEAPGDKWREEKPQETVESEGANRPTNATGIRRGASECDRSIVAHTRRKLQQRTIKSRAHEDEARARPANLNQRPSGTSRYGLANADGKRKLQQKRSYKDIGGWTNNGSQTMANANGERLQVQRPEQQPAGTARRSQEDVVNSDCERLEKSHRVQTGISSERWIVEKPSKRGGSRGSANASSVGQQEQGEYYEPIHTKTDRKWKTNRAEHDSRRATEPGLGGGANGISSELDRIQRGWIDGTWEDGIPRVTKLSKHRADRLKALGNAVVPQQVRPVLEAIYKIATQELRKTNKS